MPTNESLDERLARFHGETMRAVVQPGAAAVRRTVVVRQRRRVALAGVAALVAVASAIGVARWAPTRVSPVNPDQSASASSPASPSAPTSSSPSAPASTPPSSPANTGTPTTTAGTTGADLHVTGPSSVTLTSDGTVYRGQFSLTVLNSGPGNFMPVVYLTLPTGITIDFDAGDPGFRMCLTTGTPGTMRCSADVAAAGRSVNTTVHVVADYAPQSTDLTIPGVSLRYAGSDDDPTPGDNSVTPNLVLSAT